jgi:hypothetical protein
LHPLLYVLLRIKDLLLHTRRWCNNCQAFVTIAQQLCIDTVVDEDRGSQEVPGSHDERAAQQRHRDFLAMRATGKAVATAAPLLLQALGGDLLAAVLDGGAARSSVALEMASLAFGDVRHVPLVGPQRERVRRLHFLVHRSLRACSHRLLSAMLQSRLAMLLVPPCRYLRRQYAQMIACLQVLRKLQECMFGGPAKSAGHAVRAAAAFFPPAALGAVLDELAASVTAKLDDATVAGTPDAVTVVHAMSELLRVCPSRVEASAAKLVDFAMAETLPADVGRMAVEHSAAFAASQDSVRTKGHRSYAHAADAHSHTYAVKRAGLITFSAVCATLPAATQTCVACVQAMSQPASLLPGEAQAKAGLIVLLTHNLLHGYRIACHRDKGPLSSAIAALVSHLHNVTTVVSYDGDDVLLDLPPRERQRALDDEGLLRLASATSLLRVAMRLPEMMPAHAFSSVAMTVQDPIPSVRTLPCALPCIACVYTCRVCGV